MSHTKKGVTLTRVSLGFYFNRKNPTFLWIKFLPSHLDKPKLFFPKTHPSDQGLFSFFKEKPIARVSSYENWKWLRPSFYKKLVDLFFCKDQQKDLSHWIFVKTLYLKKLKKNLWIHWTFEKMFRITLGLFFLLNTLQVTFLRYHFFLPGIAKSFKVFKETKVVAKNQMEAQRNFFGFQIYDQFLILESTKQNYRICYPAVTTIPQIYKIIKKNYSQQTRYSKIKSHSLKMARTPFNYLPFLGHGFADSQQIQNAFYFFIRFYLVFFPVYVNLKIWNKVVLLRRAFKRTKASKIDKSKNKKRFHHLARH